MSPYHQAILIRGDCDQNTYKKKKAGPGISLILCNQNGEFKAQSYRFDANNYTFDNVETWLNKARITPITIIEADGDKLNAKLNIKANNPSTDGLIWSSGIHHVFVNDKPSRILVPPGTIMDTFNDTKATLNNNGHIGLGIDHLKPGILEDNEILAKMNLLDVGDITKIGTDGEGIFILESSLNNPIIQNLHRNGELPAYSIVGEMEGRECPTGQVDYIVDKVTIERVDFVEEGGCQICKVGEQPNNLILTSKKAIMEDNMKLNANEAVTNEPEEAVVVDEPVISEPVEETKTEPENIEDESEGLVNEANEAEQEPEPQEEPETEEEMIPLSKVEELIEEKVKEVVDGKKPKINAKTSDDEHEKTINKLIEAGRATPKMKESLLMTAKDSPEAFQSLIDSLPVIVDMKMKSKLSKPKNKAEEKPKTWDEEFGELAKHFRI